MYGASFFKVHRQTKNNLFVLSVFELELFRLEGIDAGLAASIFHFREVSIKELKTFLKNNKVPVRTVG